MMNCNWMVKAAMNDRAALVGLGVAKPVVDAMDWKEVVAALKARKYDWKKAPKLNGNY